MKSKSSITTLFTDIGGVLLTNGWDRRCRKRAVDLFRLDADETEERHHLTFDTYESGKLTLDEYLGRVVFYEKRSFSKKEGRLAFYFYFPVYGPFFHLHEIINGSCRLCNAN